MHWPAFNFKTMAAKTKIILFSSTFLLVIAVLVFGYFLYNKGTLDIKSKKGIPVAATDLYLLYSTDSLSAGEKYTDNVLVVSGEVFEISNNPQQQKVILVKTETPGAFINCTFEEPVETVKQAERIKIKGICSGMGQGYPDMGIKGDVYLTRCFLVK